MTRAEDLEQLAAKLGQAPTGLSAFRQLSRDQVGLLSDLIDKTCARRRRTVEEALARIAPALPKGTLVKILRGRGR